MHDSLINKYFIILFVCFCTYTFSYGTSDDAFLYFRRHLILRSEILEDLEDNVFAEEKKIRALMHDLYKKNIELIALYYGRSFWDDAEILYRNMLIDIGKDAITLMKSIALYMPLLYRSKKISFFEKSKKMIFYSGLFCMCGEYLRRCISYKNSLHKLS